MLNNVKLISNKNINKRRYALMEILDKNNIEYTLTNRNIGENYVKNIIVNFNNNSDKKIVIGAHYDNLEGSLGANDNATGVAILIEIVKYIKENGINKNIDIVFFDREEYADRGSEQYIKEVGKENIQAMINIDTCGFGDTIIIGTETNLEKMYSLNIMNQSLLNKKYIQTIKLNPGSDDRSFEEENIPNIHIQVVPQDDLKIITKIIECELNELELPEELLNSRLKFMETIHNGKNDNLEIVNESSMLLVLDLLISIIRNIQK